MTGFPITKIEATRGEIWIPTLSILVGRLDRPLVTRRRPGDDTPQVGQFDLQAVYSFLNEALFNDDDFTKEWSIFIGRRRMAVNFTDSTKVELIAHARAVRLEGVNVEWQSP